MMKNRFLRECEKDLRKHQNHDCDCMFSCFDEQQAISRTIEELKKELSK